MAYKKPVLSLRKNGMNEERLTDKERLFVFEYRIDRNGARAARSIGYAPSKASNAATRLLKKVSVQRALLKLDRELVKKLELSVELVAQQLQYSLTRSAEEFVYPPEHERAGETKDINDMSERARAVINGFDQEVSVITLDDGREIRKIKTKLRITDKNAAIDLAMKHKGMFAPVQGELKVTFDWDQILADARKAAANDPIETRIRDPLRLPDPRKKREESAPLDLMNSDYTAQELVDGSGE